MEIRKKGNQINRRNNRDWSATATINECIWQYQNIRDLHLTIHELVKQFSYAKEKLSEVINKIRHLPINMRNTYLYYNMHQVYFGYGIMKLNQQQEKILQEMHEKTILRKLGLRGKFLREVLYSRKTAIEIGLLKLLTIIAILVIKLCIGHKRTNDWIANMTQINEEHAEWQYGFNNNIINVSSNNKFNQITWNDEIGEIL